MTDEIQKIRKQIESEKRPLTESASVFSPYDSSEQQKLPPLYFPVDFGISAKGYKLAADILADYVAETGNDYDYLVNPVAFLYRQYLELRLKDIIIVGSRLSGMPIHFGSKSDFLTHDLIRLW